MSAGRTLRAGLAVVLLALVGVLAWAPDAVAAPGDDAADLVIGQGGSFTSGVCNLGGVGAGTLCGPRGVAYDEVNDVLYIADTLNNRIQVLLSPGTTDQIADYVLGQPGFVTNGCNTGGLTASSLCGPRGVSIVEDNSVMRIVVADAGNNRVLVYNDPIGTDTVADFVFGQPGFVTNTCNFGGLGAASLCQPAAAVYATDYLGAQKVMFIADTANNRVQALNDPLTTDSIADVVLGQPGFVTNTCNFGGVSAASLCEPTAVRKPDPGGWPSGDFFVPDTGNSRILAFIDPLATDAIADGVFGQPDLTTTGCNSGGLDGVSGCSPEDIEFLDLNNDQEWLAVVDTGNNRVRFEVHDDGEIWSAALWYIGQQGNSSTNGCNEGGLSAVSLCGPRGVAGTAAGALIIADTDNNRVLWYDGVFNCADDADCDGFDNTDASSHSGPTNANTLVDNCSSVPNAGQPNGDGNYIDNSPPYAAATDDKTWANSDAAGDACDLDDDNDGLTDADEGSGAGCGSVVTDPLVRDTDGDRYLDGAECAIGTDPTNAASKPVLADCGAAGDADGDKIADRVEYCFYNTSNGSVDTDGDMALDGAKDGCEIASLNGDRIVSSIDQGMLASGIIGAVAYTANVDINKDGVLSSIDQGIMASFIVPPGQCP